MDTGDTEDEELRPRHGESPVGRRRCYAVEGVLRETVGERTEGLGQVAVGP